MQPADLVLIHNYVLQALARPANKLNDDFDLWASLPNIKGQFIKYCQVFPGRLRTVLHDYRIEPDPKDPATTVKAKGFVEKYSARTVMSKQKLSEITIDSLALRHNSLRRTRSSTASFRRNSQRFLTCRSPLLLLTT